MTPMEYDKLQRGLEEHEVKERVEKGLHNATAGVSTKSEKQIIIENTLTFFNVLNIILAVLVLIFGTPKNALFMGVVFSNAIIGCVQEIRSKRVVDKLSLLSAPKATVLRSGKKKVIAVADLVLDDLMILSSGSQISADAIVAAGEIEVNESLLTGESDPILKRKGDKLLSGSFVVSGSCKAVATAVGADSYANKIVKGAKYLKKPNSEIMRTLNFIVKISAITIIPAGILLFLKQHFILGDSIGDSVVSTVAALIGMIPEGLVLLTSVVFAVAVIRLSAHNTLVQELYCIETLARVDVLCLDKTGTITEGRMELCDVIPTPPYDKNAVEMALSALADNLQDSNPTFDAVKEIYGGRSELKADYRAEFSSARKWSGASFVDQGTYILGAYEFVCKEKHEDEEKLIKDYSEKGFRVLAVVGSWDNINSPVLPSKCSLMGFVVFKDKIRENAPKTINYFKEQGVKLKVISGDNAAAVSSVALRAGIEGSDNFIDMSTVRDDDELEKAAETYSVFGRVTPEQKLKLIKALKKQGHTVAMTGDGVNDVLALKESDCSIAMAAGSDAARAVSNLVLLDSDFASMPKIVKEGRRSINNLQRTAALFLTKTFFFAFLSVFFIFVNTSYPFEPIQMTLISVLTIGIPSFLLALAPNKDRVKGSFIVNVIRKAAPISLTMAMNMAAVVIFEKILHLTEAEISTLAVLLTAITGFILVLRLCRPFNLWRGAMCAGLIAAFTLCFTFLKGFFGITGLDLHMIAITLPATALSFVTTFLFTKLADRIFDKRDISINIKDKERYVHRYMNRKNR